MNTQIKKETLEIALSETETLVVMVKHKAQQRPDGSFRFLNFHTDNSANICADWGTVTATLLGEDPFDQGLFINENATEPSGWLWEFNTNLEDRDCILEVKVHVEDDTDGWEDDGDWEIIDGRLGPVEAATELVAH
jgi:hypothetical protein